MKVNLLKIIRDLILTSVTAHPLFLRVAAIHILFSAAQNAIRGILPLKNNGFHLQM